MVSISFSFELAALSSTGVGDISSIENGSTLMFATGITVSKSDARRWLFGGGGRPAEVTALTTRLGPVGG